MQTYTGGRNLYGSLTLNTNSTNLTFGDTMINEGIRAMLGSVPWPFLEKVGTETSVAAQQAYKLPGDLYRLIDVYYQVGSYKYNPTQVTSFDDWNRVNNPAALQSDTATFYFVIGNELHFWPTPASNGNSIVYSYLVANRDLSIPDYTTGTIVTATNGSRTITGSGTSWTAGMAGMWLRITAGAGANLGDGLWYQVSTVDSATQLTLVREYAGTSIAAGSAAYTLGDCSPIPEKYQVGPVYYAACEYYKKNADMNRAEYYQRMYDDTLRRLVEDEGTKTTSNVVDDGSLGSMQINPNLARYTT
jgi:hypothetical protein